MPNKKTLSDAISEIKRELALRKQVYPRWIEQGKITRQDANHQYQSMERALELLQELDRQANGQQMKISL